MQTVKINPAESMDDLTVVDRIIEGEKELYEILMRRNNQKLYRAIRSYISNLDEVEDVMQNTYLKGFEKLYQFNRLSQFSTWLIKIGINECLKRLNRNKKINLQQSLSDSYQSSLISMSRSSHQNPEQKVLLQEAKIFIEKTIDNLDPKYKAVFILKEIEGMRLSEIAECLDLSLANAKVRLHRAKAILKEQFYEIYFSKDIFEFGFSKCDRLVEKVMSKI